MIALVFPLVILICHETRAFHHHGWRTSSRHGTASQSLLRAMNIDGNIDKEDRTDNIPTDLSFEQLGVSPILLSAIKAQGWKNPTPIQTIAIPAIIQTGTDTGVYNSIWAEAPTGSGKTAAYILPLIQLILALKKEQRGARSLLTSHDRPSLQSDSRLGTANQMLGGVTTLILSPTRELSCQIGLVVERLMSEKKDLAKALNVAVITGGSPIEPQIAMLTKQCSHGNNLDILIATPGRLLDVFSYQDSDENSPLTPQDKELEQKLLEALDQKIQIADTNKSGHRRKRKNTVDMSLSFADIEKLKVNEIISTRKDDCGRSSIKNILSNVQFLVLDEADRLLSSGFKVEMDKILSLIPRSSSVSSSTQLKPRLKTFLFSATFPKQIELHVNHLLQTLYGKNNDASIPLRLLVKNNFGETPSPQPINDQQGNEAAASNTLSTRQQRRLENKQTAISPQISIQGADSTIDLRIIRMDEMDRTPVLRKLLEEYGSERWDRVLVFVSTRYSSEHVAQKLTRANIQAAELHGKLDQDARTRRLDDFQRGKIRVLIATDLASRGLDVVGLPAVINYDLPRSTADFIHRIGRCGRAQHRGTAISFVTPTNESHMDLIEKRHLMQNRNTITREVLPGFEPDEEKWLITSAATKVHVEGVQHSVEGLAHDRMFGGVKGRRKSKKDKIREKTMLDQQRQKSPNE